MKNILISKLILLIEKYTLEEKVLITPNFEIGNQILENLSSYGKQFKEEGRPTEETDKLIDVIERFMNSDLWGRIDDVEEKYFEVPFALSEEVNVVYGVIDLVFKEDGKWVIADYKTDDFEKDEERKKVYTKQVELYKKYWEEISGERVKETLLYKLI